MSANNSDISETQNSSPSNGQDESYAIDVERKCCKICKDGLEFTDRSLKKHFLWKHPNVSVEYDSVKSRIFVECSSCRLTIMRNIFERHKNKVHACRRTVNDMEETVNEETEIFDSDVRQNREKQAGQCNERPCAIEIPLYMCKICKIGPLMTENKFKLHNEVKHDNALPEFELKPGDRVKCSICNAQMFKKNFNKHKVKHSNLCYVTGQKKQQPHGSHQVSTTMPMRQETYQSNGCDNKVLTTFTNSPSEVDEAHAIDILVYHCNLCKVGSTNENDLKVHFYMKHNNAAPDYDVKPGKRVKCSICGAKMYRENFNKHKTKVHRKDSQLQSKNVEDGKNPCAIDVLAMKCKVCGAECGRRQNMEKHFAKKHKGVPMELIFEKSNTFVRCSACDFQVLKKHFNRHKRRCAQVQALVNVDGSLKVEQMTNLKVCQEKHKFNRPLVNEKHEWNQKSSVKEDRNQTSKFYSLSPMLDIGIVSKKTHTEAPRLFRCRICDVQNILEQNKMKHHLKHYRSNSSEPFVLEALDDNFHVMDSKSESNNQTCKKGSLTEDQSKELPKDRLISIKIYRCFACDASGIMEPNLVKHHLNKHNAIPIEISIFEVTGTVLRERCGICQKLFPEGRVNDHMKRHHPMRLVLLDPVVDIPEQSKVFTRTRIQNTDPVITELYKCSKCKAVVSKDNMELHGKNHGSVSNLGKLFKSLGTRNVIKCAACLKFIEPEKLTEHIKQHRSLVFVSIDGTPLLNPKPAIKTNVTQKPFVTQPNSKYLPKYRNIYKCRICHITRRKNVFIGDTGLDGIGIQKHQKTHRNCSIDGNIFRLIKVKLRCNECDQYINEKWMEGHMKKVHSWNYDMNFTLLYKCGCCDAHGMSKRNLADHHARVHNFPIDCNKFKVHAVKQKIVCDCCEKRYMEGRPKKHNLKVCLQRANTGNMILEGQLAEHDK